jgi:hypothetical protein
MLHALCLKNTQKNSKRVNTVRFASISLSKSTKKPKRKPMHKINISTSKLLLDAFIPEIPNDNENFVSKHAITLPRKSLYATQFAPASPALRKTRESNTNPHTQDLK